MIDKFVRSIAEAMAGIKDGSTVLVSGFAQIGEPRALVDGLIEQGARDLTVVHNTAGRGREGVARLIGEGRVRKIICSFARSRGSVLFEEVYARGDIELEIVPQGTLAERIRAGGAGVPAFFTRTGVGTQIAEGKDVREFDGQRYVMERGIVADLSIVHAHTGDTEGNLVYRKTARNFNPVMATAGRVTVAEVEHLVPAGQIDPDQIHTPGIFVQRIVHYDSYEKRIEQRTVRKRG
jgi:3-oxoacid CoA-transferase A subunit